jgi:hypothetical protein
MTSQLKEFSSSSNGDRWFLGRDQHTGHGFVEHRANLPSGGAVTRTEVADFLAGRPLGPQHEALSHLVGGTVDGDGLTARVDAVLAAMDYHDADTKA